MTKLDASLIQQGTSTVPLNDLTSVYHNANAVRMQRSQLADDDERRRQAELTNAAYRAGTRPDGSIDGNAVQAYLAGNMGGAQIPGIQKANSALAKEKAEIADKAAGTDKTVQEILYNGLKMVDNTVASLAAREDLDEKMVYGEMGRLVTAGAFNAQAKHVGVSPDAYAKDLLSTMPVGNPQQTRAWLIQQGAKLADATQRLAMSLPKYDEQDRGGELNEGTINQMTGKRTAGASVDKTNTPGEVLSAQVTREGQGLVDRRAKQFNDITAEANNSRLVETPQGHQVVNIGTANARPVAGPDGQPLLGKDSEAAKNVRMADRMLGLMPQAKALMGYGPDGKKLPNSTSPTASGAGAMADSVMNAIGVSTKGSDAAGALETLSGWMTSNVPRFEGPQSDADRLSYREMAGLIGDRTKPIATRLKAAETVENAMQLYRSGRVGPFFGPPGTQPATMIGPRPATPNQYRSPAPGAPARPGTGDRPSIDSFFK